MDNNIDEENILEPNSLLKNYIKQTISAGLKEYKDKEQNFIVIEMKKAIDETEEPKKISLFKRLRVAFNTLMIALFSKKGN
jgi:hypothetical protein